jgi:hypothetical protein
MGRIQSMRRLTVTLSLIALAIPDIGMADEGAAKKVCIIEDPPGTIIRQIDAPNDSSAGAYCIGQVQALRKSNPNASVRLGCFTQGIPNWPDGLHELHSAPCQSLR